VSWFYKFCKFFVKVFFLMFTRWNVSGRENIPEKGGVLVVGNHMTFAEPQILHILLKREARFATKEGFFRNKIIGTIMKSYGSFPVHPGRADIGAIRRMKQFLAQGLIVGIFPEGTRSLNRQLIPASHGAAAIAQSTGVPIIPVGITGTEKMKGFGWIFKRPVITIKIGAPFHVPPETGKKAREAASQFIMERIAELLPAEYHGVYAKQD
jgi:1-acyl-sn-glycerol-3-phosphate acyltransferase